ncbi:MAG TPA: HAMP domain-containing sensor histidine kinase [Longimicrobiales bacterium]
MREDMQRDLELLLEHSARLAQVQDEDVRAAAASIEAAALHIAARLSRFEEPALEILTSELTPAAKAGAEGEAGPPGEAEASSDAEAPRSSPSPQLTRALAGELSQLARHADTPLDVDEADGLRPRIRRAARLANLWLTTSLKVQPQTELPPSAGVTSTYGPRSATGPERRAQTTRAAAAPPGREPPASAAAVALAERLARLQREKSELQERAAQRERYWREAIHELRNAAHAFMSWGFVLRRSELKDTPWFAPLVRAAESVLRRAEEALSHERHEGAPFVIRPSRIELTALAREALESIRPAADARSLALAEASPVGRTPVFAFADPDRVLQSLHNLLRNAVEATPPAGSICVTVEQDADSPFIEVEDTGPGVADDIFDTLPPAGRTGPGKGFGVGLRLSRDLAQRMGGSLGTAPVPAGGGARFVLRLPAPK